MMLLLYHIISKRNLTFMEEIPMREVMEYELKTKQERLKKLQEYFKVDLKDMDSMNYEDNAINSLLEMKKIKTETALIEYYLQMK